MEPRTKTGGPFPGGLSLTHTHMTNPFGGRPTKNGLPKKGFPFFQGHGTTEKGKIGKPRLKPIFSPRLSISSGGPSAHDGGEPGHRTGGLRLRRERREVRSRPPRVLVQETRGKPKESPKNCEGFPPNQTFELYVSECFAVSYDSFRGCCGVFGFPSVILCLNVPVRQYLRIAT